MDDLSRVSEVRRAADAVANTCGLGDAARGVLAVVVDEAATNLVRHAIRGVIYLRDTVSSGLSGVEVLAVDSGPGMRDVELHFADRPTSGRNALTGLGAMRHMAHELDTYSLSGSGTVVVARVFKWPPLPGDERKDLVAVGVVCRPFEGEEHTCGDGWAVVQGADRAMVLIVDAFGRGESAAEAAEMARDVFLASCNRGGAPRDILVSLKEALRGTPGAAVAVAEVQPTGDGGIVTLAGAGNVAASVIGIMGTRNLLSLDGTRGPPLHGVHELSVPMAPLSRLILHTDGIASHWKLGDYPRVLHHDPAVAAALIHRDFTRGDDDATVVAVALRSLVA